MELSLFLNAVTTLVNHLTSHYGPSAELETYVICAKVTSPDLSGGSKVDWIAGPDGHGRAGGVLQEVLNALENNENGTGRA